MEELSHSQPDKWNNGYPISRVYRYTKPIPNPKWRTFVLKQWLLRILIYMDRVAPVDIWLFPVLLFSSTLIKHFASNLHTVLWWLSLDKFLLVELLGQGLSPVLRLLILGLWLLYDSLPVITVNHLLLVNLLISLCLLSPLTQLQPGDSDLRHCTD